MEKYFEVVKEFINTNDDVLDFVVEEGAFKTYEEALKYVNTHEWDLEKGEQITIWDCNEDGSVNDSWVVKEFNNEDDSVNDSCVIKDSNMENKLYKNGDVREVVLTSEYRGYKFFIVTYGTHPCAYVRLPKSHPYSGMDMDDMDISCHGGITFYGEFNDKVLDKGFPNDGEYIGWDYAHAGDYYYYPALIMKKKYGSLYDGRKWTLAEIEEGAHNVINQLIDADNTKSRKDMTESELKVLVCDECQPDIIITMAEQYIPKKFYKEFLLACLGEDIE